MASDHPESQPFRAPVGAESTGHDDAAEAEATRAANRFDIRRIIGGVFILYGGILLVVGIVGSEHVKTKADGININLWAGIGMLIFGVLMMLWGVMRPVQPEPAETRGEGSGRIRRAPAT